MTHEETKVAVLDWLRTLGIDLTELPKGRARAWGSCPLAKALRLKWAEACVWKLSASRYAWTEVLVTAEKSQPSRRLPPMVSAFLADVDAGYYPELVETP